MVKPFAKPEQQFMQIHNSVFDIIMPDCSPTGWVILCAIIRKTRGWGKESDRISYSQLKDMTGIKSSTTISKYVDELERRNLIIVQRGDRITASCYSLNVDFEIDLPDNGVQVVHEMDNRSPRNGHTKDTIKDTIKDLKELPKEKKTRTDPHALMVKALMEVTGMDMGIKSNAGRIVARSKELLDAGYTHKDVEAFGKLWHKDWRYTRDRSLPTLTTVLSEVSKVKGTSTYAKDLERRRAESKAMIDKAKGLG